MFALAAKAMGYRVHVLADESDSPAGQVADVEVVASYDDVDAVRQFASNVAVVTFEFENVSSAAAAAAQEAAVVRPAGRVLHTTQNRLREKTFLRAAGLPVTPFASVGSVDDLIPAAQAIGITATPSLGAVLKTADWGYDGKGQRVVRSLDELHRAFADLNDRGKHACILEAFIDFTRELSIIAVRGVDGTIDHFGPMENQHRNHILDLTLCPARVSAATAQQAVAIAQGVMEALDVVGVLCIELFERPDGSLMINELAPRPHNSGHLTLDAHASSQFDQQVRAICGLPLASTRQLRPAAMANLLGDLWTGGEPHWPAALAQGEVALHLYGKHHPRPGRKMGHLTALADAPAAAAAAALAARKALS
jgi:5-(carboxyamino)imidazole ribonucleotide synthase